MIHFMTPATLIVVLAILFDSAAPTLRAQTAAESSPSGAAARQAKDQHGDPLPPGALARLGTIRWRHDRVASFAALRPDGQSVVTVGDDLTIRLWAFPSGKEIRRINLAPKSEQTLSPDFRLSYFLAAAMTPDGKTVAVSSYRGIRFFDIASGWEVLGATHGTHAVSLAFSGNGERLAVLEYDGQVSVWEWLERKRVSTFDSVGKFTSPRRLTISPDGKVVAAIEIGADGVNKNGVRQRNETVKLWNADTGAEIGSAENGKNAERLSLTFSPDGKTLAFGSRGEVKGGSGITLVEAASGKKTGFISGKGFPPTTLVFSKDGAKIFGRTRYDNSLKEWNVADGALRMLGSFPKQPLDSYPFNSLFQSTSIAPDGKTLILAGADHYPLFIDIASGQEIASPPGHGRTILGLWFSADSKRVFTHDLIPSLRQWDAASGASLGTVDFADTPFRIAGSPAADVVGTLIRFGGCQFVEATTGRVLGQFKPSQNIIYSSMLFAGDGQRLALSSLFEPKIEVFEVPSGRLLHTLQNGPAFPDGDRADGEWRFDLRKFIVSPDGRLLANYVDRRTIALWDITTGQRRGSLTLPGVAVPLFEQRQAEARPRQSGAFSPDGRCLAVDVHDGTVLAYELATGQVRRRYTTNLATESQLVGTILGGGDEPQNSPRLAYSPDGRSLAHAGFDHCVRVWDTASRRELAAFRGHTGVVTTLAFAPDGRSIASAGWDTTALVWDVSKLTPPQTAPSKIAAGELEGHWQALAADNADKGFDAILALAAAPDDAIPFIEKRIRAAAPVDPQQIERFIGDLDSVDFKIRDRATTELLSIGERAASALEKALAGQPPLESRRRLETLLEKSGARSMTLQGERLRAFRAVEILERIATPEARRVLQSYASGAPGAVLTISAGAALKR
jgi:WD40 repeat protein